MEIQAVYDGAVKKLFTFDERKCTEMCRVRVSVRVDYLEGVLSKFRALTAELTFMRTVYYFRLDSK